MTHAAPPAAPPDMPPPAGALKEPYIRTPPSDRFISFLHCLRSFGSLIKLQSLLFSFNAETYSLNVNVDMRVFILSHKDPSI